MPERRLCLTHFFAKFHVTNSIQMTNSLSSRCISRLNPPRILKLLLHLMMRRRHILRLAIQITQIRLPPDRYEAYEYRPVLHREERKAECRHGGPHLHGVNEADRHRKLNALDGSFDGFAGEERLGAEEEGIEGRREDDLVDQDFGPERKDAGGVVEVLREKDEPGLYQ